MSIVSVATLAFSLTVALTVRSQTSGGLTDYAAFYAAGRLLGEGNLYDTERLQQIERETTGQYSPAHGFVRLPFYAAMHWPLSRLDYPAARFLWNAGSMLALLGFLLLWPWPGPLRSLPWVCLSLPAFLTLANGQDVNYVLLFLALGARLFRDGKEFAAGLAWSLCAVKFHLFLPLPIVLLAARRYTALGGLAVGGAALGLVSFGIAGLNWPLQWLAAATAEGSSPNVEIMPNLRALTLGWPQAGAFEAGLAVAVLMAAAYIARKTSFAQGLAAALAAGVLASHHAYMTDMALLLPAGLVWMQEASSRFVRLLAISLITPVAAIVVMFGWPASAVVVTCALALLVGALVEARAA